MEDPVIVSLGVGGRYPKLLNRLKDTCVEYGVSHKLWTGYPDASRSHHHSPYGFKIHVIREAMERGNKLIVWADSAVWIVQNPDPFFQLVKNQGILFLGHGDRLNHYVNDVSLKEFGFNREDMKIQWMVSGSLFGFDFSQQRAVDFFEEWAEYERTDWFRENEQKPSGDFLQHRHDEAIVSLMLVKYKIPIPNVYNYFQGGGDEVMFRAGKDL